MLLGKLPGNRSTRLGEAEIRRSFSTVWAKPVLLVPQMRHTWVLSQLVGLRTRPGELLNRRIFNQF